MKQLLPDGHFGVHETGVEVHDDPGGQVEHLVDVLHVENEDRLFGGCFGSEICSDDLDPIKHRNRKILRRWSEGVIRI